MEKIKKISYLYLLIVFASIGCVRHKENFHTNFTSSSINSSLDLKVDTVSGDTSSVKFALSGLEFYVHYYNKKPQYIRVKKTENKTFSTLSYRRDNSGVFIGLSDSGDILSFGSKYLNGNEIANFHLDSSGKMVNIEINNNYYVDTPYVIDLRRIRN